MQENAVICNLDWLSLTCQFYTRYPVVLSQEGVLAFERLKQYLTTTEEEPENWILMKQDFKEQFIIYTDTCNER